jgi:hypothetical protein
MARVKVLKKGLQALDRPKIVGVVINETLPLDRSGEEQYYAATPSDQVPIKLS